MTHYPIVAASLSYIGNNALLLASRSVGGAAATPPTADTAPSSAPADAAASAIVRLLVYDLSINKTVWERDHAVGRNVQPWALDVPSRLRAQHIQHNAAAAKRAWTVARRQAMTPAQKAEEKKLSPRERQRLVGMQEPERSIAW